MEAKLKRFACDPACGFMMQSHDEKEILQFAKEHSKNFHKDLSVSEATLKQMIKSV